MNKRVSIAIALLTLGGLTTGCATSSSQGVKTSVVATSVPTQALRAEVPDGGVLAVIRYPAIVEDDAKDTYHRSYARRGIGGRTGVGVTNTIETVAVADSIIIKSSYFALSLYKELAAQLPEHAVLLSPHVIKLGPGKQLTSEPITAAENLPSVVSIDFATYSFPDSREMMGDVPVTFGDLVTPLVTVRTDHRASAPTQGVLLTTRPLATRAAAEGRDVALATIKSMQSGDLTPAIPELDFISFITNDSQRRVAVQKLAERSDRNATLVLPLEKIRIPEREMDLLRGASDGTVDPIDDIYTEALSSRIVALINSLDIEKAIMMGKASSVAQFDPSLAALTFVGSDDPDYLARAAYADRLLDTQRKFLSVQSLRIFDGIHNGELGAQVRDMISAEHDVLEKRRALGGQSRSSSANNCNSARSSQEYLSCLKRQTGTGIGSVFNRARLLANARGDARAQRSEQVGTNFLNAIVPALEQQTTVTLGLLDSNETITAIRYEDLQAKLQDLYSSRQRSLETVATQCGYIGQDGTKRGTWMGVCDEGLANGSGAGVLKTDVDLMEYYGYARNGLADGLGLMIRHTSIGSISYEGSFEKGRPHGIVRVSQAGRADQTRTYVDGMDRGESKQAAPSPFGGNADEVVD